MLKYSWIYKDGQILAVVPQPVTNKKIFKFNYILHICDMIKGNESDVADIVFKISAKQEVKFFCFILFSVLIKLLVSL